MYTFGCVEIKKKILVRYLFLKRCPRALLYSLNKLESALIIEVDANSNCLSPPTIMRSPVEIALFSNPIHCLVLSKGYQGCLPFTWKTRKFRLENQMECIILFEVFLKLWASGQSDAYLLLLLGFTFDVHVFHKLNHFLFMTKISVRVVCVNGKHPRSKHTFPTPLPKYAFFAAIAADPYPSDLQTTLASLSVQWSSQMVPQVSPCLTSTRPSDTKAPLRSLTSEVL